MWVLVMNGTALTAPKAGQRVACWHTKIQLGVSAMAAKIHVINKWVNDGFPISNTCYASRSGI